jgi:hypothetical protein
MKNLILILLLVAPAVGNAQIWYVGGKGGVSFSNYKSRTPWKEVTNVGYTFGVSAFKQVSTNIGVGLEFQYIQKGYYHKICNTITDQLDANYLEIPVMFDYTFLIPGLTNWKAHANVGFYAGYWLSAKYRMQGFDTATEDFDFDKSGARRFDFGPNAGGRIEYILKHGSLSLDCRYELGILDMQSGRNNDIKNTNRALVIGINYMKVLNF